MFVTELSPPPGLLCDAIGCGKSSALAVLPYHGASPNGVALLGKVSRLQGPQGPPASESFCAKAHTRATVATHVTARGGVEGSAAHRDPSRAHMRVNVHPVLSVLWIHQRRSDAYFELVQNGHSQCNEAS